MRLFSLLMVLPKPVRFAGLMTLLEAWERLQAFHFFVPVKRALAASLVDKSGNHSNTFAVTLRMRAYPFRDPLGMFGILLMALGLANASRSAAVDATKVLLNNGYLRIYSGTRPANANTALSGNTLLAELRWNATAFGSSTNGVTTAGSITSDSSADATGTATFARNLQSDATTLWGDFNVGTSGSDLNLNTVSIVATGTVSVTSCTLTQPE